MIRVLLADDQALVRAGFRALLNSAPDIEVVGEAADGEEVVRLCAQDPPDAVVLDLLMPRMTGFEVIPILQRDHPHVGIVAYTAVAGDFVRREMARLGIRLLLKSGDSGPLARALHEAAEQARADA